MKIEKKVDGSQEVLKIIGRLDTATAPTLEKELDNGLESITELVMDFEELEYISSAGLRILLKVLKVMKPKGTFVIRHVNQIVKEVFEVTGFIDILNIE